MRSKPLVSWIGASLVLLAAGLLMFVRVCSQGGGMAAAYMECDCRGIEWLLYDRTAADGPRKSLCIGIVASRRCFQFMGGQEIDCRKRRTQRP